MSSVISSFGGATGSYYEGKATASALEENARLALMEAKEAAEDIRSQTSELIGKQRTLYAKAGVDVTSGSPLLQMAFTKEEGEKAAKKVIRKGKVEYTLQNWYADLARKAGKMSAISQMASGIMSIGGMVMGGIGGAAGGGGFTGGLSGAMAGGGSGGAAGWGTFLNSLKKTTPQINTFKGYGYGY